ncbi:cytochrome oxidase assembly protein ShyY1 [Luteimonas cucumeris]|uniref:SURF1-like protein n=1 Tax=Luteimonas cucumeris TaxID=985012 RepID=A0A562LEB2_9GAMM|nr:SURF1 family protein [Luteimonas cucumeris]TWI05875.1 cytochrome oxidase assembly protein ShyY1 [Luteimonas cucumeris]
MSRRGTRVLGWTLAVLAMASFTSLGLWQLDRQRQKQAMLDEVGQVLAQRRPLPLASAADPARKQRYDWAAGEGRFVGTPAVLLDNQLRDGRPGVLVYRLFQPASGAAPLLVELGWLPLPGDRLMPTLDPSPTQRQLQGLLLPPPSAGLAKAQLQPQSDGSLLTAKLDPSALQAALQSPAIAVRILRPDPAMKLGYARDLDILPNTLPPERHLGYAVQWFALALAVLATALILTFRKPRR